MNAYRSSLDRTWLVCAGYIAFVVYGSLVPLEFNGLGWSEAVDRFLSIRMYNLGVESRADWISNGVLYVPLGFLMTLMLRQWKTFATPRFAQFVAAGLALAIAAVIEFAQVFFPPRTVSLNDLVAEAMGSLLGIALAGYLENPIRSLRVLWDENKAYLGQPLLLLYCAAYLAYSLFPFDLLVTRHELVQKIQGPNWGWLFATDAHGLFLSLLKLLVEWVSTIPVAILLIHSVAGRPDVLRYIALGWLWGTGIEIAQFFTASGVTQGASVLARAAAFGGVGWWLGQGYRWRLPVVECWIRQYALGIWVAYLMVLVYANGWGRMPLETVGQAGSKLGEIRYLPFYYHYYTTEAKALISLASVSLMYLPVGLLAFLAGRSGWWASGMALVMAGLFEFGKLFLRGVHPDPTNLLLAFASAGMTVAIARFLVENDIHWGVAPLTERSAKSDAGSLVLSTGELLALIGVAVVCWHAASFPRVAWLVLSVVAASAVSMWLRPVRWLFWVAALMPVFDLAPWTGRIGFDEFDLVLSAGLMIAYARTRRNVLLDFFADRLFATISLWLLAALSVSVLITLFGASGGGPEQLTVYLTPLNALRVAKGAAYAFIALPLIRFWLIHDKAAIRYWLSGCVLGYAGTVSCIIWERVNYVGLTDFTSDYRVTGPFSAMHVGGAFIEAYLALATPFVCMAVLQSANRILRLGGIVLMLVASYALAVSFSRSGYLAFGSAMSIFLLYWQLSIRREGRGRLLAAVMALGGLAVALPVVTGTFAQQRFSALADDYHLRQEHWQKSLALRGGDFATQAFGVGVGRYPLTYYLFANDTTRPGSFSLETTGNRPVLKLGGGSPIYFEQIVSIQSGQRYRLSFDVSADQSGLVPAFSLCEKWMLTSISCKAIRSPPVSEPGVWKRQEAYVDSGELGVRPWYGASRIKFAFALPPTATTIRYANVRLEDSRGRDILYNGAFEYGTDGWFFSADEHLPWHAKQLWLGELFDLGWFGVGALATLVGVTLIRGIRQAWRGNLFAAAATASILAILLVGLFDTLIDAPRFLMLFVMIAGMAAFTPMLSDAKGNNDV